MSTDTTLVHIFLDRVASSGDTTAIWIAKDGAFQPRTWNELANDVFRVATSLVEFVEPGERVAQLSENRYEWIVCDLAIQLARAIHVPIHAPLASAQVVAQIQDCDAHVVMTSTVEQVDKILVKADDLPGDLRLFCFEHTADVGSVGPFSRLLDEQQGSSDEVIRAAREHVTPDSIATLLYTSGTTGEPKGVILTQRNLTTNALATLAAIEQTSDDIRVNFLPLSHVFARTCDLYTWIALGSQLALAESRESVIADCQALHPTTLNGVPYFFDKIRRALIEMGKADEPDALRNLLGGEIRFVCSGGAALPDHVFDFFQARDVPILQGYGLTETSPVISVSSLKYLRRGASGKVIQDVEVRIAEDDEILTRGPHLMSGYYQRPEATDEVIQDGWFHTGDYGDVDEDGFLFVRGRKKEIIVTSGGKNVSPVQLESLLTEDPLILQAIVIGDDRNYLTALIVPDPDRLRDVIIKQKWQIVSPVQALTHPQVIELFDQRIQSQLATVSRYEQVQVFTLLDRGFTIESGEMTPKLSLRRNIIAKNFEAQIEAMYRKP
jgi:long-chain acyl-CoA synthetase